MLPCSNCQEKLALNCNGCSVHDILLFFLMAVKPKGVYYLNKSLLPFLLLSLALLSRADILRPCLKAEAASLVAKQDL